jgi:hypothetical protein
LLLVAVLVVMTVLVVVVPVDIAQVFQVIYPVVAHHQKHLYPFHPGHIL